MEILETKINDLVIIKPSVFGDNRGYFFESYNKSKFESMGLDMSFVQDNQSMSHKGVLRGPIFKHPPTSKASWCVLLREV